MRLGFMPLILGVQNIPNRQPLTDAMIEILEYTPVAHAVFTLKIQLQRHKTFRHVSTRSCESAKSNLLADQDINDSSGAARSLNSSSNPNAQTAAI